MSDYLKEFPIPAEYLPATLRGLLSPENADSPSKRVVVTSKFENNKHEDGYEYLHMLMACVPLDQIKSLGILSESSDGVVQFSTPCCTEKGDIYPVRPSVSSFDYVVASWGNSSHYSFSLAEKIWMTLGLSPRVIGNSEQKIIYDDLSLPIIGVADGDLASEYHYQLKRDVNWTIRNDYLRKYLWMTGCCGVRVFFYEAYITDCAAVRSVMGGQCHYKDTVGSGWCELDIREVDGKLLLQIWATIPSVEPTLCKEQDIYSLVWPGDTKAMTIERVNAFARDEYIFLDDKFLERYEKDSMFDAVPFKIHKQFSSCPSYKGQWSYRGIERVGRNLLKIPLYELYRNVPEQEIYHAHQHAVPEIKASELDPEEEHIASKADKLLLELISLGENLSLLIESSGCEGIHSSQFLEFSRDEYLSEGFRNFPVFQKLSQVAPINMYEQDFLSRCKTLNEIICKLKVGPLRRVLRSAGSDNKLVSKLQGLKLLQGILNIVECLNDQNDSMSSFNNSTDSCNWEEANTKLAPLFINNDLRNAEAHEAVGKSLNALERLGFDSSSLSSGYGKALDFLLDGVVDAIKSINVGITSLLAR